MNSLEKLNITKVARAIEKDGGCALTGLRKSLKQAKAGEVMMTRQGVRRIINAQALTKETNG